MTDDDLGTVTATATLNVFNVAPQGAINTGNANPAAGGTSPANLDTITLSSVVTEPSTADKAFLTYLWTVTKNGSPFPVANNTSPTFTFTKDVHGYRAPDLHRICSNSSCWSLERRTLDAAHAGRRHHLP